MEEYDHLCTLMTSRNKDLDYQDIKEKIVEIMYRRGIEEIEMLRNGIYSGCGKIIKIRFDIDFLLEKFHKIHREIVDYIEDPNHVGLINIFAFQYSALISLPYKKDNPTFYSDIDVLSEDTILTIIDLDYLDIKEYLVLNYFFAVESENADNREIVSEYTYDVLIDKKYPIFFFRWIDHEFSAEKIIEEYFDRIYYCEIIGKATFADGVCEEPLGFLLHDMFHGTESEDNCIPYRKEGSFSPLNTPPKIQGTPPSGVIYKKDLSKLEKIKGFYNYCKKNVSFLKLKQIRIILFYQIHEDKCSFDLSKERVRRVIKLIVEDRFYDENDLKLAIPKKYRDSKKKINEYLSECLDTYFDVYPKYETWLISKVHESRRGKKHHSWNGVSKTRTKKKTISF